MRRLRLPIIAAVLACTALGAAAAPAQAYTISGYPWPGPRITYYTAVGSQNDEVIRAAKVWNRVLDGVYFSRRSSARNADVVVRYDGRGCGGYATVGYSSFQAQVRLFRGCPDGITRLTAIHELGHVLGLGHENRRCALMNPVSELPTGTPNRCRRKPLSSWLRTPLQRDDRNGIRALYPGSGRSAAAASRPPAGPPRTLR